jgi:hypothetical protein
VKGLVSFFHRISALPFALEPGSTMTDHPTFFKVNEAEGTLGKKMSVFFTQLTYKSTTNEVLMLTESRHTSKFNKFELTFELKQQKLVMSSLNLFNLWKRSLNPLHLTNSKGFVAGPRREKKRRRWKINESHTMTMLNSPNA